MRTTMARFLIFTLISLCVPSPRIVLSEAQNGEDKQTVRDRNHSRDNDHQIPTEDHVWNWAGREKGSYKAPTLNDRPIIGVLAVETLPERRMYGDSYVMSSYVSFLEMAGARVVPIRIEEKMDYYISLFNSINGALFPSGSEGGIERKYRKAARIIFELAKQSNSVGDYFPIFGIARGHELLASLVSGQDVLTECHAEGLLLSLYLTSDYRESRLMKDVPGDILRSLTKNITTHNHRQCITVANFYKSGLHNFFRVVSTNKDLQGRVFVSMMEGKKYPFYGSQWQPQDIAFSRHKAYPVVHTREAVSVSQYFANFYVGEARKNHHRFPDEKSEGEAVFQNCEIMFHGAPTFHFNYYFDSPISVETMIRMSCLCIFVTAIFILLLLYFYKLKSDRTKKYGALCTKYGDI